MSALSGDQSSLVSTKSRTSEYQGFSADVQNSIRELARTITQQSERNSLSTGSSNSHGSETSAGNPMFDLEAEPRLDPLSDSFDSEFWIRSMQKLIYSDPDYYKPASLGVVYKNLRSYGNSVNSDYQSNCGNIGVKMATQLYRMFDKSYARSTQFDILKSMDGIIPSGKLTVLLGRPGAGCSTFLKTIAAQTYGFHVDPETIISYDGLTPKDIQKNFRGDVVYCAETEDHFPQMTVGDTLRLAAQMRTPANRPKGVSREMFATHMADVAMATFGLSHTKATKVGNDFIRGVSGGERKRVSIAEVYLSHASVQCWDNSTRGLDSATALEFIRALKTNATVTQATPIIAIYQCSQDAYDLFDNTILMYEGYQIYCGDAKDAKDFFVRMGYHCPARQTTADFLTSLTNPKERVIEKGFEDKVPRTPLEFYNYWQSSPENAANGKEIDEKLATGNVELKRKEFHDHHRARQSKNSRPQSSFMISFPMQVKYVAERNFLRIKGDPSVQLFGIIGHTIIAVLISTIFIQLSDTTKDFYSRTAVLFFAILFNAFSSLLEIFSLYEARAIVEKHKRYALYHPSADAMASIFTEFPSKIIVCICFNLIIYFVVRLRQSAGHFFFYLLMSFTATLTMSHLFRSIGAATKSLSEAMTPASILLLALTIFTGFIIPPDKMHGWCRWINYIDPIAYAFEGLIANEFHGRQFPCSVFVPHGPGYEDIGPENRVCSVVGGVRGESTVSGDLYIELSFSYYNKHKWRNWGILLSFAIVFLGVYIVLVEYNKGAMQKGEILVFQRSSLKKHKNMARDIESDITEKLSAEEENLAEEKSEENDVALPVADQIFHWRDITYSVKIKTEQRILLNKIDGWVKPGQVTALMGASGAGKTTLLNCLSDRLTSGVVESGSRMVNGRPLDSSFQRSIGYVQQQDLHLSISTVREALRFSAYLRQPASVSKKEKDEYVEYVIDLLEMSNYSGAVVGVPGEGLNVEQRKRLTIGVELAAKPKLLVFLDEPTSGLDSQTAWSICKLIRKLADHGQAILCTIHQPSAMLMREFDRLLFLQKGGQTIYFGDLGTDCSTLISYFELYGAPKCPPEANPVEWMLEVIGAAPGSHAIQDYFDVWRNSKEYQAVQQELDQMEKELIKLPESDDPERFKTYATGFGKQYILVLKRVFEQYWRTPKYAYSKIFLSLFSALFNGFAFFKANKSIQGLQNQMFSVFMFLVVFNVLIQQYLPHYIAQRSLYEVRERPSKTFSWIAFILAQITVEIPWNILCGTLAFFCWYYPTGMYNNAVPTDSVHSRGATMWFAIVLFYIYTSTMGQMCVSFIELADNAAHLSTILFTCCLNFCGVLVPYDKLPHFWKFMYRFNPFTYLVSTILSVGLANSSVTCAKEELLAIIPTGNLTCSQYMDPFMSVAGGYLASTVNNTCYFCTLLETNVFLLTIGANFHTRWRDIGVFIGFIVFDVVVCVFLYWLVRVPKRSRDQGGSMLKGLKLGKK